MRNVAKLYGRISLTALLLTMAVSIRGAQDLNVDASIAAIANGAFATDLYRQLLNDGAGTNLFVSPFSVFSALAIVAEGANGATGDELRTVLHSPKTAAGLGIVHGGLADFLKRSTSSPASPVAPSAAPLPAAPAPAAARTLSNTRTPYELLIANALWGERSYPFDEGYVSTIRQFYGPDHLLPVDFLHESERARQQINAWAEEQTNGKIQNLLAPRQIQPITRLVVANAVYFKAAWSYPFQKAQTRPAPFHLSASSDVQVPLMQTSATLAYVENDRFQAVALPYVAADGRGRADVSMVVVLPKVVDGLAALEATLTGDVLVSDLSQAAFKTQLVRLWLPKFSARNRFDLTAPLQTLGMRQAFVAGQANFSRMSSVAMRDQLHVSVVVHQTFVNVDEEGTEAAAATAVAALGGGRPPTEPPPAFRADHPFFYMIRHNTTGMILFMGRVVNPTIAP